MDPVYRFDDFLADPVTWRLSRRGKEIHLEPVVLKLLIYLIANRGRLVTRKELMDTVWGDTVISESALTKAVARLRKALDDDVAAPRYVETVRSQGYRFVAPVEEVERPGQARPAAAKGRVSSTPRSVMAAAAAIAALIIMALVWPRGPQNETAHQASIRSIAVLPFNNLTGDPEKNYYVDGLQDILITELSQIRDLRVTSRQSTMRYRSSDLPATEIAGELGVDAIVEGSLLRKGDQIEATVQLIDGRSDEHLWAERYTSETPDVFNLIADMANAIGIASGVSMASLGTEELTRERMGPVDPRAVDAYALGVTQFDQFTRHGIQTGIEQFERAVAIEPDFALAWGQLGAAYAMQGMFGFALPRDSKERLRAAELKAIDADPQVALGHSGLGFARLYSGDFDGACESFEEALRINPSEPYAIHGDADCLLFEGRMDDSVARARELLTISPFSAMHSVPLPSHLYMARRFDEAITAIKAMQARIPRYSAHWMLARVFWQQGRFEEALEEERLELERRGDTVLQEALEEGAATAGPTGAMRAVADALVARSGATYVDPVDIGELFARAGMIDESLHWLDEAAEVGSYEMTYMAFWPHLDVVRDDPRYEDLLEGVYGDRAPAIRRLSELGARQD
ncbi:MAG: winged helix-turn-helix domain-containing protein [Gammaproteobacteria bacterium]